LLLLAHCLTLKHTHSHAYIHMYTFRGVFIAQMLKSHFAASASTMKNKNNSSSLDLNSLLEKDPSSLQPIKSQLQELKREVENFMGNFPLPT
jgi:hypothetical protein